MAEFDIVVEQLAARMHREHKFSGLSMAMSLFFIGMAAHAFYIDFVSHPSISFETVVLIGIGIILHIISWLYAALGRNTVEAIKLHNKSKHLRPPPLRELDEPNPQFWN